MRRFDGSTAADKLRLALLTAAAVATATCGAGDGENAQNGVETRAAEGRTTPPAKDGEAPNDAAGGSNQVVRNEGDRSYERDWKIGDGGEVELRFEEGALDLLDVRPNQGWSAEVGEGSADAIEVKFLRKDEEWRFDAEAADGRLEVKTGQKLRDAEGGTYRLGDAGAVEIRQEGGGITFVQTRSTGNWGANVVGRDGDEV